MTCPESYDELLARIQSEYDRIREEEEARAHIRLNQPIRTKIRKVQLPPTPPRLYYPSPPDPDFPYVVRDLFTDEEVARFRYASDADKFAEEDLTMYTVDTTPQGEGEDETND